jgi:hypothetical protein
MGWAKFWQILANLANFRLWENRLLWTVYLPYFLGYFFTVKRYVLIVSKMGWAKFWAIFSRPHPVTLPTTFNANRSISAARLTSIFSGRLPP